jgi:hypothetical protein
VITKLHGTKLEDFAKSGLEGAPHQPAVGAIADRPSKRGNNIG